MTEEPNTTADEVVETPVEETTPDDTEDLGALKRAYERVKAERQEARDQLRRIEEDEDARTELLQKWGFEVAEDKPDEEDDLEFEEDDPIAPVKSKLDELTKWQQEREAERMAEQIKNDLSSINEGSDWELDEFDRQQIVNTAARDPKGFDKAALERAHKQYLDRLEKAAERGVERAKSPKPKPPHVTSAGQPGTQVPDLDNEAERHRWQKERIAALQRGD